MSLVQGWLTTASIRFRIRALKARLRDQTAEFAVIRRHLRPRDTAFDIGANKGSFVYWLSHWVGDGQVIAFEPQPDLARGLAEVCAATGLGNVNVEAKAVYSSSGPQQLFLPIGHQPGASLHHPAAAGERGAMLQVSAVALDDYFDARDRVALLKIDVEGAELDVFRGAERILRQHAPLLVFECENRHRAPGRVQEVFSWLGARGYEGSFICREQILPLAAFDAAIHQRADGDWFWKRKDYCNNFIFRKAPAR